MISSYEQSENVVLRISRNMEGGEHTNDHDQHLLRLIKYISFVM